MRTRFVALDEFITLKVKAYSKLGFTPSKVI
jgi:hypothetical protein